MTTRDHSTQVIPRWRSRRSLIALVTLPMIAVACVPPAPPPSQAPVISSFEALGAPFVDPALVALRWAVSDLQGDAITCRLDGDGDGVWDATFDPCPPSASRNVSKVGAGTYTARLEVRDGTNTTVAHTAYTVAPAISTEGYDIVVRPSGPVDADVLAAVEWAATRWEQVITRGVSDMAVNLDAQACGPNAAFAGVVDDLVVSLSVTAQGISAPAAGATPCVNGPDGLPRFAMVDFNGTILANLRTLDNLDEVALHELGHALGFGAIAQWYDLVAGRDTPDPRFIGPRALAEYSVLGRSGNIPVMTINGDTQPHWESAFFDEIMASVGKGTPLSRLTIASLADLGYAVDLDVADPYTPSLPAGTCIDFDGTVFRCW